MERANANRRQDAPVVIVVRDPDWDNDIITFGVVQPVVINIDLGRSDPEDNEEWTEWIDSHNQRCEELATVNPEAAQCYRQILADCRTRCLWRS